MPEKPLIGITQPNKKDMFAYAAIWIAARLSGAKPVKITSKHDYRNMALDGLILGGGKDIYPELYKQSPLEDYTYTPKRDEMEMFWAHKAISENIPALGICRGAQLMNVACGGSLHASVAEAYEDANYPDGILHHTFYRKDIMIRKGTLLHRITKKTSLSVNSIHKQAIDRLGKDLVVNAQENNGVIQAISHTKHPYFLGIQFHPEFLIYQGIFRDIFTSFVNAALQNKGTVSISGALT